MIRFFFGCTPNYYQRMLPFLHSTNENSPFKNYFLAVEGEIDGQISFKNIANKKINREQNVGAPEGTRCIQHGSFLNVVRAKDDDIILYSDGDIIMQRSPTDDEVKFLSSLEDNQIAVGWNSGPHERLIDEAMRLRPRKSRQELVGRWGELINEKPCFNVGVVAANGATYKGLHERYLELYDVAQEDFGHMARQQWLMCYVMAEKGFEYKILPYEFHTHGHYGIPKGAGVQDGVAHYNGQTILFRHKM